jgi:hypothetical protein
VLTEQNRDWGDSISLFHDLSRFGKVAFLDFTKVVFPRVEPLPKSRVISKCLGYAADSPVVEELKTLGAQEIVVQNQIDTLPVQHFEEMRESIRSSLITVSGKAIDDGGGLLESFATIRLERAFHTSYLSTIGELRSEQYCSVFIPNGRFPAQKASALAAKDEGVQVFFFEAGFRSGKYYVQHFQPQNFIEFQKALSHAVPDADSLLWASSWFEERQANLNQAKMMGVSWGAPLTIADYETVIFTSSPDEFEAVGNLWKKSAWKDQYEAIACLLRSGKNLGKTAIRVHPNSRNKPLSFARREGTFLKQIVREFPNVSIIFPSEPINSYLLARKARLIFVWDSTVGLESSWMGKKVVCFTPSIYGEFLELESIYNPTAVEGFSTITHDQSLEALKSRAEFMLASLDFLTRKRILTAEVNFHSQSYLQKLAVAFLHTRADPLYLAFLVRRTLSTWLSRLLYRWIRMWARLK